MTNSAKDKGDQGERDVEDLLWGFGIETARRELGAGRKDDMADIDGVPNTAIQVARTKIKYLTAVINKKTIDVERQRRNRRVRYAACFIRWDYGKSWIVVLTPAQWFRLWSDAVKWRKHVKAENALATAQKSTRHAAHGRTGNSAAHRPSSHRNSASYPGKARVRYQGRSGYRDGGD